MVQAKRFITICDLFFLISIYGGFKALLDVDISEIGGGGGI